MLVVAGAGVPAVAAAYLAAPAERPAGCSDCGLHGGRWWEPWLAVVFAAIGLAGWLLGMAVAALRPRRR